MVYLNKLKQLPQPLFYMSAGTFLNRMGSAAVMFLLLYLHNHRLLSLVFAGTILSCYGVGALFAGPIGGWASDKYGALQVSLLSLCISGILMLIYPFVPIALLIFMTFLWGLAGEAYRPASQVMMSHLCEPEQRKLAYSLNRLALNLGMSIAPLLGGILVIWNYDAIFYVDGITSILAAIFLHQCLSKYFKEHSIFGDKRQAFFTSLLIVLKDHRMLHLISAMILSLMIFFQQTSTLSLFMVNELHLTTTLFGLTCVLNTIIIVLFELPISIKMSNSKFHTTLALSAICIASGFGLYYFAQGLVTIAIGVVIWTLGEMILFSTIAAYIFKIAPEKYRGTYMGLYSMGINIAFIAGPLIGTFLYHKNDKILWFACFLIGLLSAFLFYRQGKYEKTS